MKIQMMAIDELVPYENNAKIHTKEQIDSLSSKIKDYGFDQPIVVDENNVILKGHGRRLAAQKLGLKKVPVYQHTGLNESEKKAIRIHDNAVSVTGWDNDLLKLDLTWLKNEGFELFDTGLSNDFIFELMPFNPVSDNVYSPNKPPSVADLDKQPTAKKEAVGAQELSQENFENFDHTCPRCNFEFNSK